MEVMRKRREERGREERETRPLCMVSQGKTPPPSLEAPKKKEKETDRGKEVSTIPKVAKTLAKEEPPAQPSAVQVLRFIDYLDSSQHSHDGTGYY